ncbi:peptide chain release factor N(5)-glutamine methyltransferase [soil metagenome]
MTTAAAALASAADRLAGAGCESARVDAEILLAQVLETTRSALRADARRELDHVALAELDRLVARRERREPLAYVLGEWGFRRLTLKVDSRVLVPRPETEVVVQRCLARIAGVVQPRVLDVGTGSGAIALAIADDAPGAEVTAMDASPDALEVARENAARTGRAVELVHGDLCDGLPEGPWDLVVSNPPYVRPDEIETLEPEVRNWEPRVALVGEGATESVASAAVSVLRPGGALVLETADGDAGRVRDLIRGLGCIEVRVTKDLSGRDRVVDGVTTSDD